MRYLICLAFSIFLFFACHKEKDCCAFPESPCLEDLLESFKESPRAVSIQTTQLLDRQVWWLNTDLRHLDGPEYIVDAKCDTVCMLCSECYPPPCMDLLGDWKVVWKKQSLPLGPAKGFPRSSSILRGLLRVPAWHLHGRESPFRNLVYCRNRALISAPPAP